MDSKHNEASPLQSIMKGVALALRSDAQGRSKEAYVQYLSCMQLITESLNRDAQQNDCRGLQHADTQKMFKLMDQCMERIKAVAETIGDGLDDDDDDGRQAYAPPPPPYTPFPPIVPQPVSTTQTHIYPNVQGVQSNSAGTFGVGQYANTRPSPVATGQNPPQTSNRRQDDLIAMLPSVPGTAEPSTASRAAPPTHQSLPSSEVRKQSVGGFTANVMMSYKGSVEAQYGARRRAPSEPIVSSISFRERLKYMSPLEKAYMENQHLIAAYKARMNKIQGRSANDKTTVNLTLQRRLMDNLAIAQARQESLQKKMAERQQRLQQEAVEKFSSLHITPTVDEIERRQIYANVMEYEQNNLWLLEWREKLKTSPQDSNLIHQLVNQILWCKEHPITQLLQKYQYNIYKKLYTIIQQNADRLDDISVPYGEVEPLTFPDDDDGESGDNDTGMKEKLLQETLEEMKSPQDRGMSHYAVDLMSLIQDLNKKDKDDDGVGTETQDDAGDEGNGARSNESGSDFGATEDGSKDAGVDVTDASNSVKGDLEEAMAKGERLTKQLSQQNDGEQDSDSGDGDDQKSNLVPGGDETNSASGDVGMKSSSIDSGDFNDSKGESESSVGVSGDEVAGGDSPPQRQVSVASDVSATGSDLIDDFVAEERSKTDSDFNQVEDKIDLMNQEALQRHLDIVIQDVHKYLDKLQMMFVVAYEEMDSAIARDQCIASTESYFFQPVWPSVLTMFRLVNLKKEELAATSMTRYANALPQHIGVRKKFSLLDGLIVESDDNYPYKPAVTELQKLPSYQAPLDKLECIVNTSRIVCTCVEDYYESQGKPRHGPETAIGCDDLLPILSYVVVKSQLPQLMSECSALEEFIHEGYLFGEEGYCLTSLLTALTYICKLSETQSSPSD